MRRPGCLITFVLLVCFGPILIGVILMLGNWLEESNHNPFDYARIVEVDYKAVVVDEPESYGKVIITERLTFYIRAASKNNLFWELWRDLPEDTVDGVKVEYNVLSVKQVFDDGRAPVVFTEAPKLYWDDFDFINTAGGLGPGKWFHSPGPYDGRRNFECVLFYVDGLYRETVIFEIEYEMFNAAMRWADSSELYLSMYSEDTVTFLRSFNGQILFPEEIMPRPGNFETHTFGTNSHGFPYSESTTLNPGFYTFYFELDRSHLRFRPYNRYIEFVLIAFGEDRHIFTEHASVNHYFNDNALYELRQEIEEYNALPGRFRTAAVVVLVTLSAGAAFTLIRISGLDKRMREKYVFYQPPFEIEFFREIPADTDPNFAAELVFCKDRKKDTFHDGYASVMLDLVRKGYIEMEKITNTKDWIPENVMINIKPIPKAPVSKCQVCSFPLVEGDMFCADCGIQIDLNSGDSLLEPLTQTEELYYNLLLRHISVRSPAMTGVSIKEFQRRVAEDYQYSDNFIKSIKHSIQGIGIRNGYFQKSDYKAPRNKVKSNALTLGVFGALIIILCNLISYQTRLGFSYGAFFILGFAFIAGSIYMTKLSGNYVLLTLVGESRYAKWRGLYNFLNSETLMSERTVLDIVLWEKYLVYATAFGISQKVIKALELRCTETGLNSSPMLRNRYYRSSSFRSTGSGFRSSTRSASSRASRGGGGGSGYGGGGRGGGGGGGGH